MFARLRVLYKHVDGRADSIKLAYVVGAIVYGYGGLNGLA